MYGDWTIFINVNPADYNSHWLFDLAGHSYKIDLNDPLGAPIGRQEARARRRIIANNPVASAEFFWTFHTLFVLFFLGWDVRTGKKVGRGWLGDKSSSALR